MKNLLYFLVGFLSISFIVFTASYSFSSEITEIWVSDIWNINLAYVEDGRLKAHPQHSDVLQGYLPSKWHIVKVLWHNPGPEIEKFLETQVVEL
jgi:hypothetical protein